MNHMNDTLTPMGSASLAGLPGNNTPTNVTLQKIDNGFIVAYWDDRGNHQFHCPNLGLVKDQLESLFDTN
jgi:hypothetical protein